jgi:DNA-binding response OmpR family regulator
MAASAQQVTAARVLVIEDEFEVGLDIQSTLSDAGFHVVGPVMTMEAALKAAEQGGCDVAVLDANLNGENAGRLASILTDRGVPILVVSGYSRKFLPLALSDAPLIAKPFDPARLVAAVRRLSRR